MSIRSDKIWLDGKFIDYEDAQVHLLTHTLHYGLGAFEGIRCYKRDNDRSAIFRLETHIERLINSCKIGKIEPAFSKEELIEACIQTVEKNGFEDCYIRPLVFLGHGEMGLGARSNDVHTAIITWEWGSYLGDDGVENGIRAKVSSFNRHHVNSSMVKGKINGQYVNGILAKREANDAGYDEAIMVDTEGYISEASGENIFLVDNGIIVTTPLGGSILGGITRETVIRLAEEAGYTLTEERFTRDMLYTADEVFMTGTAAEVTPVREIDDRTIGDGTPGPTTEKLQELFFDQVKGSATDHSEWLTYVEV